MDKNDKQFLRQYIFFSAQCWIFNTCQMIYVPFYFQQLKDMEANIHTIVVGSGMGGMGAASQLAKNGYSVLVLECNNHIGGRTATIPVKLSNKTTFPFDLGASWIHKSQNRHPITQLSKQIGNVKLVFTDDDNMIYLNQNGEDVEDKVQREYEKYENLIQRIEDLQDLSVYDAIKKLDGKRLSNKYFMFNISYDIEFETSSPIQDLSAEHWQEDSQFGGKQMMVVSGYQAFPEYLGKNPKIKVLTNHQVIQVTTNGSKNIVKCSNGKTFQAPNIVIAVPIGALKAHNIRFNPQLPPWKHQAIQKIRFGNVCKILIVLKNKRINRSQTYIGIVVDNLQEKGCANFFVNLEALAGVPALMTFGLGANSEDMEQMPQNELKQLIASRLRVFSDKSFTANDFDIVRTSWRSNPNFGGTYSYSGVDTKPKHWQNMARPIFERNLYFCGEHTHSKYRGSVHGAYLSGVEAASYVLGNKSSKNWVYKGKELNSDSQQQNYQQQGQQIQGQQFYGQQFQGQQFYGQQFYGQQFYGQQFYGQQFQVQPYYVQPAQIQHIQVKPFYGQQAGLKFQTKQLQQFDEGQFGEQSEQFRQQLAAHLQGLQQQQEEVKKKAIKSKK